MKNQLMLLTTLLISLNLYAQDKKVELVPDSLLFPTPAMQVTEILTCGFYGCPIEEVFYCDRLPFKTYELDAACENWSFTQDIYNSLQAQVPSVSIASSSFSDPSPSIKMRGSANTIVVVDGIRYNASILNILNPSDIEHITVALSAASTHYFINN